MTYAPPVYVAAAIANAIWVQLKDERLEYFSYPKTEDEFCEWFERDFSGRIDRNEASAAIAVLDAIGLIAYDEDPFAGRFLKIDARTFSARWQELAATADGSPFNKAAEFGNTWLKAVFDNAKFWDQLRTSDPSKASFVLPGGLLRSPEPVVFIIAGSVEGTELNDGLQKLSDELKTNNEIANDLGDDRARILSEVNASHDLVKSGAVRISAIKELLVKVLQELARKLKDKAFALGIEHLLALALKLIG